MINTLKTIKKIKADSELGKKKHFNAADRKEKRHNFIVVSLIIFNLFTLSALYYVIISSENPLVKYGALFLNLLAVVLSWLQTFYNFQRDVIGHRRIGNKYLSVMKKCDRIHAYLSDGIIKSDDAIQFVDKLGEQADRVNQEAEEYPTNSSDYAQSRYGISTGEEDYTPEELE